MNQSAKWLLELLDKHDGLSLTFSTNKKLRAVAIRAKIKDPELTTNYLVSTKEIESAKINALECECRRLVQMIELKRDQIEHQGVAR